MGKLFEDNPWKLAMHKSITNKSKQSDFMHEEVARHNLN